MPKYQLDLTFKVWFEFRRFVCSMNTMQWYAHGEFSNASKDTFVMWSICEYDQ